MDDLVQHTVKLPRGRGTLEFFVNRTQGHVVVSWVNRTQTKGIELLREMHIENWAAAPGQRFTLESLLCEEEERAS